MNESNKKIVKKIKGLLAIARDKKNDEESQSAFLLAQKLMIQYSVEKSEVEDYELSSEMDSIDEESVTIYKKLFWWERALAGIIAKNFKVKRFLRTDHSTGRAKRKIVFFGHGRDLELSKEMYILAYETVVFHSNQYVKDYYNSYQQERTSYKTKSIKASYVRGFIEGLAQRFEEQASILREKYEIVSLVPEEVEEAYKDHSKGFKKINSTAPRVEIVEAYKQGEKDGKSVDFTKRTIQA
ncbi:MULTISPECIES: DUF2786 domain-containing protein [Enterococcus]|uniref:DUF2786 domain-containing protein n=1 Tax=Enterococcus TaxID=1350 RepID=UPI0008A4FB31|nr:MULTISPECIES: DUF2786 domain-containing protein [Enterococcus]MDB1729501.1 DUF2786 domain-containing protein [Enterococcus avium]MDB1733577.1 DUF2786 domain-containing protein [Enterococcus avium]OFL82155.1 hypothetical protein HMPREF2742_08805 [Enterococcus sp. HMSC072H05]